MVGVSSPPGAMSTLNVDANLDMGAFDLLTDDVKESTGAHGVDIDGIAIKDSKILTVDGLDGAVIPKKASDNLRNSHDAEETEPSTGGAYAKQRTMTFTGGLKGVVRCALQMLSVGGTYVVYAALYKNGVLLSVIETSTSSSTYVAKTEDIDVGEVAAGETLELWVKAEHGSSSITTKEWRLSYDNEGSAAAKVNSTP